MVNDLLALRCKQAGWRSRNQRYHGLSCVTSETSVFNTYFTAKSLEEFITTGSFIML